MSREHAALVRSSEDLDRTCIELSNFFSFRRRQRDQAQVPETLLGIWIEPRMAAEIQCVLTVHDQSAADRPIHIRETAGLSGIWTICWLEIPGGKDRNEVSRLDLLGALIESAGLGQEGVSLGRFAPVFRSDTAPPSSALRDQIFWFRVAPTPLTARSGGVLRLAFRNVM